MCRLRIMIVWHATELRVGQCARFLVIVISVVIVGVNLGSNDRWLYAGHQLLHGHAARTGESHQPRCCICQPMDWFGCEMFGTKTKSMMNTKWYGKRPPTCYIPFENDCFVLCWIACSPQAYHGTTFWTRSSWTKWNRTKVLTDSATCRNGLDRRACDHTPSWNARKFSCQSIRYVSMWEHGVWNCLTKHHDAIWIPWT